MTLDIQNVLDAVSEAIDAMVITQRLFDLSDGHILMQRCRALIDKVWILEKLIEREKAQAMKSNYELIKRLPHPKGLRGNGPCASCVASHGPNRSYQNGA